MGVRAWVFGFIVLAVTAGGGGGPSGSAHRGQTGGFLEVRHAPAPSGAAPVPPVVIMPRLFLSPNGPRGYSKWAYPQTPILVTENPADEEFWEIAYPTPAPNVEGQPGARFAYGNVVGDRRRCETERETHEKSGTHTAACLGPHYFKRTGPPSAGGAYGSP